MNKAEEYHVIAEGMCGVLKDGNIPFCIETVNPVLVSKKVGSISCNVWIRKSGEAFCESIELRGLLRRMDESVGLKEFSELYPKTFKYMLDNMTGYRCPCCGQFMYKRNEKTFECHECGNLEKSELIRVSAKWESFESREYYRVRDFIRRKLGLDENNEGGDE